MKSEYCAEINKAKQISNMKFILNSPNKQKAAWEVINSVVGSSSRSVCNCRISPDEFNTYFTEIAVKTVNSIPASNFSRQHYLKKTKFKVGQLFYLTPVTDREVLTAIQGLSDSHCCDTFGLNAQVVKHVARAILFPLTQIINKCFAEGVFPSSLKKGKVIPLHKKGCYDDVNNYRPIAILPVFSKVFEELLKTKLVDFFNKMDFFADQQYGYRKNKSTMKALISIFETITESFDGNDKSSTMSLDLSKAFDCVNHRVLLEKLEYYGVRGVPLKIFQSYLKERSFLFLVKRTISVFLGLTDRESPCTKSQRF